MANVTLAIAQWIRLRLPSCHPRFDSQACHLRFFHLVKFGLYLFMRCAKRTKINKKEAGFGPFFLKKLLCSVIKRKAGNALILNTAYRDLRKFIQYKKYFPKCKSLGLSGYSGRIWHQRSELRIQPLAYFIWHNVHWKTNNYENKIGNGPILNVQSMHFTTMWFKV